MSVKERARRAKYTTEERVKFKILCVKKSKDIYADENILKWDILPHGFGAFGELIILDGLITHQELVENFNILLQNLESVHPCQVG